MTMKTARILVLAGLLAGSRPVDAHHAFSAEFDADKPVKLTGSVTKLDWTNPHAWIYLDVKDAKGQPVTWALEATGPGGLQKVGVKREDVKTGDTIKVRCHLLRDGSSGCLLGFVTPTHGDQARGHGVERDWDGGGGAGGPATPQFGGK